MLTIAAPSAATGRPSDRARSSGGPRDLGDRIDRLARLLRGGGPVRIMRFDPESPPIGEDGWTRLADRSAAVLVIRPNADVAPGLDPPGPVVRARNGRLVPVATLWPDQLDGALAVAAALAGRVHVEAAVDGPAAAGGAVGPVALLGSGHGRSRTVFDAAEADWPPTAPVPRPLRWTSERVGWEALRPGLGAGLGAALYLGHGTPDSWPAYGGVTPDRLRDAVLAPGGSPIGAMFALTCHGAGREAAADPRSFAGRLVADGVVGGVLAAVGLVDHDVDRDLTAAALEAIARGSRTLGDVVVAVASDPRLDGRLGPYRIFGDPRSPIVGASDARDRVRTVLATNPDEPVPVGDAVWPSRRPASTTVATRT